MGEIAEALANVSPIIALAVGLQVAAFLFRDQMILRGLILASSALYVSYYYFQGPSPLWDAIVGTALIASATVYGLTQLMLSRMAFMVPKHQRALYEALGELEPGLFRRLMKAGDWKTVEAPEVVTVEGEVPKSLLFVLSGRPTVTKGSVRFEIDDFCFLGEVSYMLVSPASATVELPAGAEYIEWPRSTLQKLFRRSDRMKLAVESLIAQDMARKVAKAQRTPVQVIASTGSVPALPGSGG